MRARGFSFIELVVSMALLLVITSSMFDFVHSARGVFATTSSAPICISAPGSEWMPCSETW